MVKLVNRAKMTTSTSGTGVITLGSASDGYQTFANAGVSNGDTVRYTIEDGNAFEIGSGVYTASGTTLSRTVSESSNSDNALNLSGSAVVFVTAAAQDFDNESPVILTEPPTTEVELNGGTGSAVNVTMTAQDPEGFDITYGLAYKTASNARPSQLSSNTSINQSTGVYTFTPSTNSAHAGSFTARLSASDGVKYTTRLVDFLLSFPVWYGDRGIAYGGEISGSGSQTIIEYFDITSGGNTTDFGDLTSARKYVGNGGGSNGTKGVMQGGDGAAGAIDKITIATTGNAGDFGDLLNSGYQGASAMNDATYAVFSPAPAGSFTFAAVIQYVTVATDGNAADFGDPTHNRGVTATWSNDTRGVMMGGIDQGATDYTNITDYITIASTGNATDFGDLTQGTKQGAGGGDDTRSLHAGGRTSSDTNVISYITTATTGNATDFGDLASAKRFLGSASNGTLATFFGGQYTDMIQKVTVQTTGNASDYGDLSYSARGVGGLSGSPA